jgi:predicted PurR-regulated permease PerM
VDFGAAVLIFIGLVIATYLVTIVHQLTLRYLAAGDVQTAEERLALWPTWLLALLAGLLALWVLYRVRSILLPFVLGVIIAYILDPVTDKMEARGVPRTRAVGLIFLLFLLLVVLAAVVLIPAIVTESRTLIENYNSYAEATGRWFVGLQHAALRLAERVGVPAARVDEVFSRLRAYGPQLLEDILAWLQDFLGRIGLLIITPIIAFWLLREYHAIAQMLLRLVPAKRRRITVEVAGSINRLIGNYLLGVLTTAGLVGAYSIIVLLALRVPYAVLLGFLTGLLSIIPYLGFPTAMIIIAVVMAVTGKGWVLIVVAVGLHIVANMVSDYVVSPRIYASRIGLHPLWVIFAILAGGALLGLPGVILGVPVAGIIKLLLVRLWPEPFGPEAAEAAKA